MYLGLGLLYVGAVLVLNGIWLLGYIQDREIWVMSIFTGQTNFLEFRNGEVRSTLDALLTNE
jgi:cytochrome c biogenesis protein ResB